MSNLVVARVLVSMVANSASAPTTPTRRGVIKDDEVYLWAAEQYPHDEGFLLTKELHIATPGGGQFYLSRLTPPNPADEGVVKPDKRLGKRLPHPEVERRLSVYAAQVANGQEIKFDRYPPSVLNVIQPEEGLQALAERLGLIVGRVDE